MFAVRGEPRLANLPASYYDAGPVGAHFQIDVVRKLVIVAYDCTISRQDVTEYLTSLRENSQFSPSLSELVDLSSAIGATLSTDELIQLAYLDPFEEGTKRAFVAPSDLLFGTCRMFQSLSNKNTTRVFRTVPEAMNWIFNEVERRG